MQKDVYRSISYKAASPYFACIETCFKDVRIIAVEQNLYLFIKHFVNIYLNPALASSNDIRRLFFKILLIQSIMEQQSI